MSEFPSNIKLLRQRARQHLERGPVTEGYKADRQKVIAVLNEAPAESAATRWLKNSYSTPKKNRWLGNDDPTTRNLIEDILKKEEEHADDLSSMLKTFNSEEAPAQVTTARAGSLENRK